MTPLLILLVITFFASGSPQDKTIDDIIDKVSSESAFSKAGIADTNKTDEEKGSGSCECIPYHLCPVGEFYDSIDSNCDHLFVCCKVPALPTPPVPPHTPKPCGTRNPDGVARPIGEANESEFGEFPWMVAVLHKYDNFNVYRCGGSLIHPQVVLTAAHCVNTEEEKYKVRVGEWDSQFQVEIYPHQDRDVKTVIIHPKFQVDTHLNDIALLILEAPVKIYHNVDITCLPKKEVVIDQSRCFTTGWGKNTQKGKYQGLLQKLEVPIVSKTTCEERLRTTSLGQQFELQPGFICAGGEPNQYICKGDEGSPLVCPIPGLSERYFQAGIVSLRAGCGLDKIPGGYTNVAMFSEWIDEQLVKNNFNTSYYKY